MNRDSEALANDTDQTIDVPPPPPLHAVASAPSRFEKKVVRIDSRPAETMNTPLNGGTPLLQETTFASGKSYVSQKSSTASAFGLSLYEDDTPTMPTLAAYLRSFTLPGPVEKEESEGVTVKPKVQADN